MYTEIKNHNNGHVHWNKGKLIGQKLPLKLKKIWAAMRIRLQMADKIRELALFNLAIDSKFRGCDFVKLRVCDVAQGNYVSKRATILQQKTHRLVQFEITEQTRNALEIWISETELKSDQYLFPSRIHQSPHLSTRQEEQKLRLSIEKRKIYELRKGDFIMAIVIPAIDFITETAFTAKQPAPHLAVSSYPTRRSPRVRADPGL